MGRLTYAGLRLAMWIGTLPRLGQGGARILCGLLMPAAGERQ